jgi:hypothetical protein
VGIYYCHRTESGTQKLDRSQLNLFIRDSLTLHTDRISPSFIYIALAYNDGAGAWLTQRHAYADVRRFSFLNKICAFRPNR